MQASAATPTQSALEDGNYQRTRAAILDFVSANGFFPAMRDVIKVRGGSLQTVQKHFALFASETARRFQDVLTPASLPDEMVEPAKQLLAIVQQRVKKEAEAVYADAMAQRDHALEQVQLRENAVKTLEHALASAEAATKRALDAQDKSAAEASQTRAMADQLNQKLAQSESEMLKLQIRIEAKNREADDARAAAKSAAQERDLHQAALSATAEDLRQLQTSIAKLTTSHELETETLRQQCNAADDARQQLLASLREKESELKAALASSEQDRRKAALAEDQSRLSQLATAAAVEDLRQLQTSITKLATGHELTAAELRKQRDEAVDAHRRAEMELSTARQVIARQAAAGKPSPRK